MPSLCFHYGSDGACNFVRILQPARFCSPELESLGIEVHVSNELPVGHDWLVFHGLPTQLMLHQLGKLKMNGTKLLWSLDDDWLSIPDWNPAKPTEDGLVYHQTALLLCDAILCSTPYLADKCDGYAARIGRHISIYTCPNMLDLDTFPTPPYEESSNVLPDGGMYHEIRYPINVVWTGGPTHKGDIEIIAPVASRLLRKFGPKTIQFSFQGMTPPPSLLRDWLHKGIVWIPSIPFQQYRTTVNAFKPAIWLAPLAEIEFNKSKSNLRVLEGWALGAAVAASAFGEYEPAINTAGRKVSSEFEAAGALCATEDQWVNNLSRLIEDHQLRTQIGYNGRCRVREKYNWGRRDCRLPWLAAFSDLFDMTITGDNPPCLNPSLPPTST